MVKKKGPVFIVLIFSVISGFALLHNGFLPTHDGEYHVIRFYEFDKMLRSGILYPRWAPDLNNRYGVPLFNFVYPLPNYIASLLHLLGFSFIDSFKGSLFIATIIGAVFMYLWSKEFWGEKGGVVSSIFYSFAPYRFVDIYIRGSVGEVWALAFFPAFLWAITRYYKTQSYTHFFLSAVLLALVIFSHNILAVMFFCFSLGYIGFLLIFQKQRAVFFLRSVGILSLGLLLSSIFWLPALLEKQYVVGLQIFEVGKNFPELYQLIIPSWGSGFSAGGLQNEMSYQIGVANLLVIFLSVLLYFRLKRKKDERRWVILFFFGLFLITLFLLLRYSMPLWDILPLLQYFQFPWRFLSLVIIICSFLAGGIVWIWKETIVQVVLGVFVVSLGIWYAKPAHYLYRDDSYYITRSNFIDGTNSPGNLFNTKWLSGLPPKKIERAEFPGGSINVMQKNSTDYTFITNRASAGTVRVHLSYFPGWISSIDGKQVAVQNVKGLQEIKVPKGEHTIHLQFTDTMIRSVGKYITLLSSLILILPFLARSFGAEKNRK